MDQKLERIFIHKHTHRKLTFKHIKCIEECLTSFLVRETRVKVTEIFFPTHQTGKKLWVWYHILFAKLQENKTVKHWDENADWYNFYSPGICQYVIKLCLHLRLNQLCYT